MIWKRIAFLIYPFLIGFLLPVLFFTVGGHNPEAKAGIIRRTELSPDRPLVVRLAQGRSTAISFGTRPEKVVPGNPQALEINFLGRDLTLRPLGGKPGNLIIYTKSNRYVILLQMVSDTSYDDAVSVNSFPSYGHPVRLGDDTFLIEEISIQEVASKKQTSLSAFVRREGKVLDSDSLPDDLRCKGCILKKQNNSTQLLCGHSIQVLECRQNAVPVQLKRIVSGS